MTVVMPFASMNVRASCRSNSASPKARYRTKPRPSRLLAVYVDDLRQHRDRFLARPLERVAADDRAGTATVARSAGCFVKALGSLGGPAGAHHETPAVEAGR